MKRSLRARSVDHSANSGSMADIAFLLLIFFMLCTKIMSDQGILVKLPQWVEEPISFPLPENRVFTVKINAENEILVEGERVQTRDIKEAAKSFILSPERSPNKAVVSIQNDRGTRYETYLEVYNELRAAYREIREEAAVQTYGKALDRLTNAEKKDLYKAYPIVISEAEPTEY
ncbi:MAG: biopolymer transporter ExbD [Bacteroidota bacterium]